MYFCFSSSVTSSVLTFESPMTPAGTEEYFWADWGFDTFWAPLTVEFTTLWGAYIFPVWFNDTVFTTYPSSLYNILKNFSFWKLPWYDKFVKKVTKHAKKLKNKTTYKRTNHNFFG